MTLTLTRPNQAEHPNPSPNLGSGDDSPSEAKGSRRSGVRAGALGGMRGVGRMEEPLEDGRGVAVPG